MASENITSTLNDPNCIYLPTVNIKPEPSDSLEDDVLSVGVNCDSPESVSDAEVFNNKEIIKCDNNYINIKIEEEEDSHKYDNYHKKCTSYEDEQSNKKHKRNDGKCAIVSESCTVIDENRTINFVNIKCEVNIETNHDLDTATELYNSNYNEDVHKDCLFSNTSNNSQPSLSNTRGESSRIQQSSSEEPCDYSTTIPNDQQLDSTSQSCNEDDKPFVCHVCLSRYSAKSSLSNHIKTHMIERIFRCEKCTYNTRKRSHYTRHLLTHTGEKPFKCEFCLSRFVTKNNLQKHLKIHTGEKPFACEFCSYRCTDKASLESHLRTHKGEKTLSCEYCPYRCTHRSSLICHLRTHTGQYYYCEYCPHKSLTKASLADHLKRHTGEKPYTCEHCSYRCSQRASLTSHLRMHTGDYFTCDLCPYRCIAKGNLTRHLKSHAD